MKKIMISILALIMVSCATAWNVDTENSFIVEGESNGKTYKFSCQIGIKYQTNEGVKIDNRCTGWVTADDNVYKCSLDVNSGGEPVTKKVDIKEECTVEIKSPSSVLEEGQKQ